MAVASKGKTRATKPAEEEFRVPKRKTQKERKVKNKEKSVEAATVAIQDVYRGSPILQLWKADENGEPIGETPITAFGIKKCALIFKHRKAISAFLEEHSED